MDRAFGQLDRRVPTLVYERERWRSRLLVGAKQTQEWLAKYLVNTGRQHGASTIETSALIQGRAHRDLALLDRHSINRRRRDRIGARALNHRRLAPLELHDLRREPLDLHIASTRVLHIMWGLGGPCTPPGRGERFVV